MYIFMRSILFIFIFQIFLSSSINQDFDILYKNKYENYKNKYKNEIQINEISRLKSEDFIILLKMVKYVIMLKNIY